MEDKTYDCLTCPYPRHKTPELIFCDVCIRRIMDKHQADKEANHITDNGVDAGTAGNRAGNA